MPTIFTPGKAPNGAGDFFGRQPRLGPILTISGVTRDSTGDALAACSVHLLRTRDDVEVDQTVSDGSGNYSFVTASPGETYYVVAYLPGSPDVAGTTVNTLAGV